MTAAHRSETCCPERRKPLPAHLFRGVVVTALLCLLWGCRETDIPALYSEAAAAAGEGHLTVALDRTRRLADLCPDSPRVLVLHAFCLFETGRKPDAIDVLQHAVAVAPDDFLSHYFLGWFIVECPEYGDQRFADALEPLENAYRLRQGYPEMEPDILVLLGRCCLEQNVNGGSRYLQSLRRYRRFAEQPEVYNCLGWWWISQGEYANARAGFEQALERRPGNAVVLQNLAVLHDTYLNEPTAAMRYYRDALIARREAADSTAQADIIRRLRQLARERLEPAGTNGPG